MQDIHGVGAGGAADGGGGSGRFFGGVGDRRLRPHNQLAHLQALKCPRCDSLNTKFCYYNNYNLSQPRYFCKSCRRYWTKGGVLRNVPVGGGCRKPKRSKPNCNSASSGDPEPKSNNNQSSSSEGSNLTAATTPPSTTAIAGEGSPSIPVVYGFTDTKFFNPSFDHRPTVNNQSMDGQIFPTAGDIGNFTSLMSSEEEMMGFGMRTSYGAVQEEIQTSVAEDPSSGMGTPCHVDQFKMQDLTETLDWGSGTDGDGDQGLFDLTASTDPTYNWSRTQWTHSDHSLNYLP